MLKFYLNYRPPDTGGGIDSSANHLACLHHTRFGIIPLSLTWLLNKIWKSLSNKICHKILSAFKKNNQHTHTQISFTVHLNLQKSFALCIDLNLLEVGVIFTMQLAMSVTYATPLVLFILRFCCRILLDDVWIENIIRYIFLKKNFFFFFAFKMQLRRKIRLRFCFMKHQWNSLLVYFMDTAYLEEHQDIWIRSDLDTMHNHDEPK